MGETRRSGPHQSDDIFAINRFRNGDIRNVEKWNTDRYRLTSWFVRTNKSIVWFIPNKGNLRLF